jgi:hypothetical protein
LVSVSKVLGRDKYLITAAGRREANLVLETLLLVAGVHDDDLLPLEGTPSPG